MKRLIIFFILSISLHIYGERIDLSKIDLSLEEFLHKVETVSYASIYHELAKREEDYQFSDQWLAYLPSLSYSFMFNYSNTETGEIPPGSYEKDFLSKNDDLQHKLQFRQKLFDSDLITHILKSKNYEIFKKWVDNIIIYERYLARDYYFNTLVLIEKYQYYQQFIEAYEYNSTTGGDFGELMTLLSEDFLLQLNEDLLVLKNDIQSNKYVILQMVRLPLSKDLTLTSQLTHLVLDYDRDVELALKNNRLLMYYAFRGGMLQKDLALEYMDFIPRMDINYNQEISTNLDIGIDVQLHGKSINADLYGDYLIYRESNNLVVSRLNERVDYDNYTDHIKKYDFKRNSFTLIGTIPIDDIARNGIDIQQYKDNIIRNNLSINETKDDIKLYLKDKKDKIDMYQLNLNILNKRIDISKKKVELVLKQAKTFNPDTLHYLDSTINSIDNYLVNYYNIKFNLYEEYALYLQKVEGYDHVPRNYY